MSKERLNKANRIFGTPLKSSQGYEKDSKLSNGAVIGSSLKASIKPPSDCDLKVVFLNLAGTLQASKERGVPVISLRSITVVLREPLTFWKMLFSVSCRGAKSPQRRVIPELPEQIRKRG